MTTAPKATPMMTQYLAIKDDYQDAILFYRMGDFYEMFFEDAKVASKALDITLTSRNKKDKKAVPMCGIPYKAAKTYIAKLLEQGFKVAICDQTEDPSKAKGLVKREVVRVISQGMVVENEWLDEKSNNFIVALSKNKSRFGLCCLDLSTAVFRVTETDNFESIVEETLRLAPKEILISESSKNDPVFNGLFKNFAPTALTYLPDTVYRYKKAHALLLEQFKTLNLEGFGLKGVHEGVSTAGAILSYVKESQKNPVEHVNRIEFYRLDNYLWVDGLSFRNLELQKNIHSGTRKATLISVMDRTVTAMGTRLLSEWMRYPLMDEGAINERLDAVDEAKSHMAEVLKLRDLLKSVHDMERLFSRIAMGHASARDIHALKLSFLKIPALGEALTVFQSSLWKQNTDKAVIRSLAELIHKSIREDAPPSIHDGGMINKGFRLDLDELIALTRDGKAYLIDLEAKEKEKTGINSLKVRFNKVFGYYIEVPKSQAPSVPAHYVRKQTLVNAERYITDELKTFETKVLTAEEKRVTLEREIFYEIAGVVIKYGKEIQSLAADIARIDTLLCLAFVADQNDYCRPEITTDGIIKIEDGRHPVIEKMLTSERFVPNSIHMDNRLNQVFIITGPNMAGKSTILRQTALFVIMAQMGAFIPAKSAHISITDRIFTRVGALDNLSSGQSTFMVEMQETANILNHASMRSLVILDEIGRGTSTYDGLSIAWAVAEFLHDLQDKGVKTLFATHYHELTDLVKTKERVKNYNIAIKERGDTILFLRKLVKGGTNKSFGIQVAKLAGIPNSVIDRAKTILSQIETEKGISVENAPIPPQPKKEIPGQHVQLDLFKSEGDQIISILKKMDIARMTPMDAMICLNDLIEKSRG